MNELIRPLLLLLLALLLGCAEATRAPAPGDFPLQNTDHPLFSIYWRLDRAEGEVRAVGVVAAVHADDVASVLVELREIDPSGRVVGRALGETYGGRINFWDARPFAVELRPQAQNDRFEVRVWSFSWGSDGAGR